eukprot:TRINITY_DN15149_c0_g1_i1.p1 TRINITY_DN15149_c0_g1~~TRINITY_DN15149_c0_g1_i1.p1  ORF type:complete len:72 (+),score=13.08 TRINITY_DN15149_c0_g1_i1:106-321(+)
MNFGFQKILESKKSKIKSEAVRHTLCDEKQRNTQKTFFPMSEIIFKCEVFSSEFWIPKKVNSKDLKFISGT